MMMAQLTREEIAALPYGVTVWGGWPGRGFMELKAPVHSDAEVYRTLEDMRAALRERARLNPIKASAPPEDAPPRVRGYDPECPCDGCTMERRERNQQSNRRARHR